MGTTVGSRTLDLHSACRNKDQKDLAVDHSSRRGTLSVDSLLPRVHNNFRHFVMMCEVLTNYTPTVGQMLRFT